MKISEEIDALFTMGFDATLYLAKAKLELGEEEDAMLLFEEIFNEEFDRQLKAEAALGLGAFYMEAGDAQRAQSYYRAVRDSLGRGEQVQIAQRSIGDVLFEEPEGLKWHNVSAPHLVLQSTEVRQPFVESALVYPPKLGGTGKIAGP